MVSSGLALAMHVLLEVGNELGFALLLQPVGFESIAPMCETSAVEGCESFMGCEKYLYESYKHTHVRRLGVVAT